MDYYFAVFVPVKEGGYFVKFPDFPEAFTQGEDFNDAMEMAKDILAITVEEYAAARKPLPRSSGLEGARKWFADNALKFTSDLYHIQAFTAPNADTTPVRVTVSFPKAALEEIDHKAKMSGMTRSGFLAAVAKAYDVEQTA